MGLSVWLLFCYLITCLLGAVKDVYIDATNYKLECDSIVSFNYVLASFAL